jgi:hypothetical protein
MLAQNVEGPSGDPAASGRVPDRRLILLVTVGALLVGLVVTLTVTPPLAHLARALAVSQVGPSEFGEEPEPSDMMACADYDGVWTEHRVNDENDQLAVEHRGEAKPRATEWSSPGNFPYAPFAWAGIEPACGTTVVLEDRSVRVHLLWVETANRDQFEAVTAMLVALNYVLSVDDVRRGVDPLTDEEPELYRVFRDDEGNELSILLLVDDPADLAAESGMIVKFYPAEE